MYWVSYSLFCCYSKVCRMEECYTEAFADEIVEVCVSKYKSLKKTGKPKTGGEWTLLSCFVQEQRHGDTLQGGRSLKVVALGTGSKCIGARQLPAGGDVLHDSHAEVVARRALVLYLIHQVRRAADGQTSIFQLNNGTFAMKPNIFFHFYTSHTPCGDASIFPKQEWPESFGDALKTEHKGAICATPPLSPVGELLPSLGEGTEAKEALCTTTPAGEHLHSLSVEAVSSSDMEPPAKKQKLEDVRSTTNTETNQIQKEGNNNDENKNITEVTVNNEIKVLSDTFRTGAKCVSGETPDPRLPGSEYHVTGVLRTKPGRGDPTLSMSCSDKMFKWTVLGVQGALLMLLLDKPVYVSTVVIGQCPYSLDAMTRAIRGRFQGRLEGLQLPQGFSVHTPVLLQSHVEFPHSRSYVSSNVPDGCKLMPTPTSIVWTDTSLHVESQEAVTNGRRLGCTKKNIGTPKSWVSICRKAISNQVIDLVKDRLLKLEDLSHVSYSDLKCYSESYLKAWDTVRKECLPNWTEKPKHLKDFKIVCSESSLQ